MSENKPHFSAEYEAMLQAQYPSEIVEDITHNWRFAALSSPKGSQIPYVRVNQGASIPVMYINGFTEGIVAKAPFVADVASRGRDMILPDQHRKKIMKDTVSGKKDATFTQSSNYLAVLGAEGLLDKGPVDFVTHSYGSLIFDAMQIVAAERGYSAFQGSRVVMLAPAGLNDNESVPSLAGRFMAMNRAESKAPKQFGDAGGEMLKAGMKHAAANVGRLAREAWHLAGRSIDADEILSRGAESLTLVSYGEDPLYSNNTLWSGATRAVNSGATWVMPIALDLHGPRGIEGASHNDEQFNPSRVAPLVSLLLSANRD